MSEYGTGMEPLPIGTIVWYKPSGAREAVKHVVTEWSAPADHPGDYPASVLDEQYPDGAAYTVWPLGVDRKFGNRHMATYWVRRASLRAVEEGAE